VLQVCISKESRTRQPAAAGAACCLKTEARAIEVIRKARRNDTLQSPNRGNEEEKKNKKKKKKKKKKTLCTATWCGTKPQDP
jgi:hypothetical protein